MVTRECQVGTLRPVDARARFRDGFAASTGGWSSGYVQAGLVSVPSRYAVDLRRFAVRNPRACPLLDIAVAGRFTTVLAEGADLRRDLPAYQVWRNGDLSETRPDVGALWRDDLVTFLVGCGFTFEPALQRAGVPLRHLEQGRSVPMYRTSTKCLSAGPRLPRPRRFRTRMVVSMRPMPAHLIGRAAAVTADMPYAHGAPVHAGSPAMLGVRDLDRPDYGDAVALAADDVPVFWACEVTMQEAVVAAKLPFAITHAPGHMLITDRRAGTSAKPKPKRKGAAGPAASRVETPSAFSPFGVDRPASGGHLAVDAGGGRRFGEAEHAQEPFGHRLIALDGDAPGVQ